MDASVLICTYNREGLLASTLDSLLAMRVPASLRWEIIVVDNNSSDGTRAVVESRAARGAVAVRYLFEPRQGKSHALNTGMAASHAEVIVFTDDDVWVDPEWLAAGVEPLLTRRDIDYTGGPAAPRWERTPPSWIRPERGTLCGPIALVDYGPKAFVFEDRQRIALGVNMAVRRSVIDRVGGFHSALDRQGNSLLGQGQAEFFFRTRAAGIRGWYVPEMRVEHHVPASRMRHDYYRRWWYWKGVARARMQDLHPVSELGLDIRRVPQVLRVPRFMWRNALGDAWGWLSALVRRDPVTRIEHELMLAYFAGYVADRLRSRRRPLALAPVERAPVSAAPALSAEMPREEPGLAPSIEGAMARHRRVSPS